MSRGAGGPEVAVALASDSVMRLGLAAAAQSVCRRVQERGGRATVYVVDCGVPARARRRIAASTAKAGGRVEWLPVQGAAANLLRQLSTSSSRPYPPAAYARLLLPALLPPSLDRVVYLDADMVVRHDILPLWNEPFDGDVLFAVRDLPLDNGNAARIARTVDQEKYPYSAENTYFQSGLLVIDLATFRSENIAERAFAFLAEYPTMQFPDQDALNALLSTRTRLIDPRWNQMTAVFAYPDSSIEPSPFSPEDLAALQRDPHIVHYSGRPKPWERGCRHPLVSEWYDSLEDTSWRGWRPNLLNTTLSRIPRAVRVARKKIARLLSRS
ncbi:glycosyltransferase [Microbacterium sp. VKM Ac-2923]|uniref:glycosyltransferase family 8 protein n=1 Tax=Microbacterium sp. VKM Ac-2923 TaxID=2929476 RepID=UPI001FB41614|nr:glycosyltransferase [Microbacterium sp. VKM Ac-2923]MCJ1708728.1 hypothetical protein [Microbacterium sp. VKM Ac-2923]